MITRFSWDDLPQERMIGYGAEALVFQLSPMFCMKVYAPEKKSHAVQEFRNIKAMAAVGLQVPLVEEIVLITVPKGRTVQLPRKDALTGIGLYPCQGPLELFALTKEFIPGRVYGRFFPTVGEICSFLRYLDACSEKGFDFRHDPNPENFVLSARGVYAVDLAHVSPLEKNVSFHIKAAFREEMLSLRNVFIRPLLNLEWDIAEYLLRR